jgi:Flp pilus assembly protein TadD
MEMLNDHPLRGIGLGQLGRDYPLYQWRPFSPSEWPSHPVVLTEHLHNEYLQIAVEGGWVGLGLFLLVLLAYITKVFQILSNVATPSSAKELLLGTLAGFAALLGQALTNFPFQVIPTGVLFGFFLAAPLALSTPTISSKAKPQLKAYGVVLGILFLVGGGWATKGVAASIALRNAVGETNLGHASLASRYASRLALLAPGDPNAWDAVAKAKELSQQWQEAVDAYNKEIALNPNGPVAYLALAQDEILLGHTDAALCLCQKCLSMIPNDSRVLWLEGVCYFQLNRFEDAAHDFEKYLLWAPGDESLYVNLGVCYVKSGRKQDAILAWEKAHELNPNDTQVIQYLKSVGIKI